MDINIVNLYGRNRKTLYSAAARNQYFLPELNDKSVTLDFLINVCCGKYYIPRLSEITSGNSTMRWRARWRTRIQPEAIAVTGSGRRRLQRSLSAEGGAMITLPSIAALSGASETSSSGPRSIPCSS